MLGKVCSKFNLYVFTILFEFRSYNSAVWALFGLSPQTNKILSYNFNHQPPQNSQTLSPPYQSSSPYDNARNTTSHNPAYPQFSPAIPP